MELGGAHVVVGVAGLEVAVGGMAGVELAGVEGAAGGVEAEGSARPCPSMSGGAPSASRIGEGLCDRSNYATATVHRLFVH